MQAFFALAAEKSDFDRFGRRMKMYFTPKKYQNL